MSSFQLHWLSETARWPRHAIATNCSPNHLDWHGNWEHYAAAKRRLISHLPTEGIAVLNAGRSRVRLWQTECRGKVIEPADELSTPASLIRGTIVGMRRWRQPWREHWGSMTPRSKVRCERSKAFHTDFNSSPKSTAVAFYDDSKSTTPAATLAALTAMNRPTWLLMGGAEKEADWAELAGAVIQTTKGAAIFGSIAETIEQCLRNTDPTFKQHRSESLARHSPGVGNTPYRRCHFTIAGLRQHRPIPRLCPPWRRIPTVGEEFDWNAEPQ